MKPVLYTSGNGPHCVAARNALTTAEIDFDEIDIRTQEGFDTLTATMKELQLDIPRSAPVLVHEELAWEGEDCLVAIEEGELC